MWTFSSLIHTVFLFLRVSALNLTKINIYVDVNKTCTRVDSVKPPLFLWKTLEWIEWQWGLWCQQVRCRMSRTQLDEESILKCLLIVPQFVRLNATCTLLRQRILFWTPVKGARVHHPFTDTIPHTDHPLVKTFFLNLYRSFQFGTNDNREPPVLHKYAPRFYFIIITRTPS